MLNFLLPITVNTKVQGYPANLIQASHDPIPTFPSPRPWINRRILTFAPQVRVILENVERRSRSCWSRFGKHVGIDGARSHDLTLVESRFTRVLGHGAPGERLGEKKVSISPERKIPPRRRARLSVSYRHAKSRLPNPFSSSRRFHSWTRDLFPGLELVGGRRPRVHRRLCSFYLV